MSDPNAWRSLASKEYLEKHDKEERERVDAFRKMFAVSSDPVEYKFMLMRNSRKETT